LVYELDHDDEFSGNLWWDMRTVNNQEIAPGLYLYHIENGTDSDEKVGKFAVIR
jgi:hypothetical protein